MAKKPLTEQDIARALARFGALRSRGGVKVAFKPLGPLVDASNPDELQEATDEALVNESSKQKPS